jgi:tetratricopeptide (TPR) repeat protein
MQHQDLISSIRKYANTLQEEPSYKDAILYLPFKTAALADFAEVATEEARRADNPFGLFSIAKHGFAICRAAEDYRSLVDFFPKWLYICLSVGAYEECLAFVRSLMDSPHWQFLDRTQRGVAVLRSYAKALRNLGQFEQALDNYRASIERASALGLVVEKGITLLLIGKLYGNYLGQQSLFSAFVEEARLILQRSLLSAPEAEHPRIARHLAICHDALGQVYRESDAHLAIHHFARALHINRRIGRSAGTSRAICHLNYFRFMAEPSNPKYLGWFQFGIRLLKSDPLEERGLGVRWIQYASMLNELADRGGAEECLAEGKRIAFRYSDYKSIVRGCLVEAGICDREDPRRALSVLTAGREVARKCHLLLYESSINRALARLPARALTEGLEPAQLFERNREIHLRHLEEVKANLERLGSSAENSQEFRLLSQRTRVNFRQHLLLDFERIVRELDLNIRALTGALRRSEDLRQELLILGVVNSVARELVHEVKLGIPVGSQNSSVENIALELDRVATDLGGLSDIPPGQGATVREIQSRVAIQAIRVRDLERKMVKLKTYLSNQLRRPRVLAETVSLEWACRRALEELEEEQLSDVGLVNLSISWNIEITSSNDLVVRVVKNLIRNAIEDRYHKEKAEGVIVLALNLVNADDLALGNPARPFALSVISTFDSEDRASCVAKRLNRGLLGEPSGKEFGAGVGLDLARTVFGDLMGAVLEGVADGRQAGIRIEFPPGTGRVRRASG